MSVDSRRELRLPQSFMHTSKRLAHDCTPQATSWPSVSRVQTLSRRQMIQSIVTNDGLAVHLLLRHRFILFSTPMEVFRASRAAAIRAPTEPSWCSASNSWHTSLVISAIDKIHAAPRERKHHVKATACAKCPLLHSCITFEPMAYILKPIFVNTHGLLGGLICACTSQHASIGF